MRLFLAAIVLTASLVAAALVITAPAEAAWDAPQAIDSGFSPRVRLVGERPRIAYAKGSSVDPSELLAGEGNEPLVRVKVPRSGRVVAFDVDGAGRVVALREAKQGKRRRILALEGSRWRAISLSGSSAVDAKLAVAESGAAVAAWLQYEGSRVVVHAALKPRGARRFGAAQRISGLTTRIQNPLTVAVDDDGTAVVVFAEAGDLTMARTIDGAFTPPVRVHDRTETTAGAFAVAAAVRGQTAVVAFTRLEDLEPPQYRLSAATQVGDTAPTVETVATDVSAFDLAVAVTAGGTPLALGTPIGPPHSLRLYRRDGAWGESASFPAGEAPSNLGLALGGAVCVTWTELDRGFAAVGADRLALGRAEDPDCAVDENGRALVAWSRGPRRSQRVASFTP